jgi:hypothetical protein
MNIDKTKFQATLAAILIGGVVLLGIYFLVDTVISDHNTVAQITTFLNSQIAQNQKAATAAQPPAPVAQALGLNK